MGLFGPSQKEVWSEFAEEIEGKFIEGGIFKGNKIEARFENWTITIDTYTQSSGNTSQTYTRLRAPYKELQKLDFKVYKSGIFSGIGKALGMQDVIIGDSEFDENFIIKGSDDDKLKELLQLDKIRELISIESKIRIETKREKSLFSSKLPEDVNQLYFIGGGVIKDKERLTNIYFLAAFILKQLSQIGVAAQDNPQVELK